MLSTELRLFPDHRIFGVSVLAVKPLVPTACHGVRLAKKLRRGLPNIVPELSRLIRGRLSKLSAGLSAIGLRVNRSETAKMKRRLWGAARFEQDLPSL